MIDDGDITLCAELYFREETDEGWNTAEVVRQFETRVPNVSTDWARGRAHVEERIARLKSLGCPPVILQGEEHALDRTICISIPLAGSHARLEGFTSGFSYYDGCMTLSCVPFDTGELQTGAAMVANALNLTYELRYGHVGDLNITITPKPVDALTALKSRFEGIAQSAPVATKVTDWRATLRSGIQRWMAAHPDENLRQRWLSKVASPAQLADRCAARLESVGDVRTSHRAYFSNGSRNDSLVLIYDECTALLNLPGVANSLFDPSKPPSD